MASLRNVDVCIPYYVPAVGGDAASAAAVVVVVLVVFEILVLFAGCFSFRASAFSVRVFRLVVLFVEVMSWGDDSTPLPQGAFLLIAGWSFLVRPTGHTSNTGSHKNSMSNEQHK